MATIITPTSGGSVSDINGNVWTLDTAGNLLQNGAALDGGAGTGSLTVVSGVIWATDANTGTWYSWDGASFTAQSGTPPTSTPTTTAPTTTPSTGGTINKATVLAFINSIIGKHIISCQYIECGPIDPINALHTKTGKWLGMIGGDYFHFNSGQGSAVTSYNSAAIAYWKAGGLVALSCHMPNPGTGGGVQDGGGCNFTSMITPGNSTYNNYIATLNQIATGLQALQAAGVVVIFRPFHECNGNWFWWGTQNCSDAQFIAAWRFTHDYLVITKGLNNLLWQYCTNAGGNQTSRFPGTAYADLSGFDLYTNNPSDGVASFNSLLTLGVPASMSEFGAGSPGLGNTSFDMTVLISAFKNSMSKAFMWQQWWDGNGGNTGWGMIETNQNTITAALSDPWVLNRGDFALVAPTVPTVPTVVVPTRPTPTIPTAPTPTPTRPTTPTPTVPTIITPVPSPTVPTVTVPTVRPTVPTPAVPTPVAPTPALPTPVGTAFVVYPLATTSTQLVISGLHAATSYDFQIVATNNLGSSTSTLLSATTSGSTSVPTVTAPTVPTVAPTRPTTPTVVVPTSALVVSASGTQLISTSGRIVDTNLNIWTLSAAFEALKNGAAVTSGTVSLLYFWQSVVYLRNNAGNWFAWNGTAFVTASNPLTLPTPPTVPSPTIVSPTTSGTGKFRVAGGQIIAPNGSVFIARGINIAHFEMAETMTSAAGGPMTTLFPKINIVRVACYEYGAPSDYQQFVTRCTGLGIVVLLENHQNFEANGDNANNSGGGIGVMLTGQLLATESAWFTALATTYKNNPYVWFGTCNEPPGPNDPYNAPLSALSTWQKATYNAIRVAGGATNIITLELWGGGVPGAFGTNGGMTPSVFAPMTNVIYDWHQYGWMYTDSSGRTGQEVSISQASIQSQMLAFIVTLQQITSADGKIPVFGGESGNSTTGESIDPSGQACVQAIIANTGVPGGLCGAAFWEWDNGGALGDKLLNDQKTGVTSPYGTAVVAWIKLNGTTSPTVVQPSPTVVPTTSAAESAEGKSITSSTGAAIINAAKEQWTLSAGGQVVVNGIVDDTTSDVIKLYYHLHQVYQENTSLEWYVKTNSADTWMETDDPTGVSQPTVPNAPTAPTVPTAPGSGFRVVNGKVVGPSGAVFVPKGLAVGDQLMDIAVTNAACSPLLDSAVFQGLNLIRLACDSYQPPAYYSDFISKVTAKGIVVHIEDHSGADGGGGVMLSASAQTTQANWYAALASAFKSNAYVTFGSYNEPSNSPNSAGDAVAGTVTKNQVKIYNAIRGTGNNTLIEMEMVGGGTPDGFGATTMAFSQDGLYPASAYASMHNIVWGPHFYYWMTDYTTNTAAINGVLDNILALCGAMPSGDGQVPVWITEFGPTLSGEEVVASGLALCQAVFARPSLGAFAWSYGPYDATNSTTEDDYVSLTPWGQKVRAWLHPGAGRLAPIRAKVLPGSSVVTTWDMPSSISMALSNNNLTATTLDAVAQTVRSTTALQTGKVYFEISIDAGSENFAIGLITSLFDAAAPRGLGADANSMGYYPIGRERAIFVNNSQLTSGDRPDDVPTILSFAIDFEASTFWVSSSAMRASGLAWNNAPSDDPALAVGGAPMHQLNPGPYYIAYNNLDAGGVATLNAGASRFEQPVPAGFAAWATVTHVPVPVVPTLPLVPTESINWCDLLTLPAMRWVGNTDHIAVYYDTQSYADAEGVALCQQFLVEAEHYYEVLVVWFNGYEPRNSNGLATTQNAFGALINYFIVSNGSFRAGHCSCANADILVDFSPIDRVNMDAVLCEFILQLAEVFMPCVSALPDCDTYAVGEGLSNAMAIEMHFGGIGTTVANVATEWLDQTVAGVQRADFVNDNVLYNTFDATATTRLVGSGCCTVFFFYLRFQLLYTWPQITAALDTLPPRANLAQVYTALSGDPGNPFPAFISLLNSVYSPSVPLGELYNPLYLFPIT